jgi:hypothetical protein
MELKDVAQLFITATARVEFYWNFYVVMLLALIGWMFATKKPLTTHLKLLLTAGYIVFVCMNLIGLWGSYTFAEALRHDLLAIANFKPDELRNTRAVLAERSFLAQRSVALVIHVVLGAVVLLTVWCGQLGDDTSSKAEKSGISAD